MLKKYIIDFFIYKKKHHWFLIPTLVYFYNKETFFENGVYSPSVGFSFRWLTLFIGLQIQINPHFKNAKK